MKEKLQTGADVVVKSNMADQSTTSKSCRAERNKLTKVCGLVAGKAIWPRSVLSRHLPHFKMAALVH